MEYMREILNEFKDEIEIPPDVMLELIQICLDFNIFDYNGSWYKQIQGLAMGSPLSPIIACLYMESIEKKYILPKLPPKTAWFRYIDDILFICEEESQAEEVLNIINTIEDPIKFTIEKEINNSIPFLDVNIIKENDDVMEFDVYRKSTNAENYIHYFSAHPTKTKTGILIGFFLRAFRICSYKYIDSEITKIYDAFLKRGYSRLFINDALKKAKAIFYNPKKEKN